jgi:hypothetical protein
MSELIVEMQLGSTKRKVLLMNSSTLLLFQFMPLKRTKNNELVVLDVYNLIERYFYINLQEKQTLFQTYLLKYFKVL